MMGKQYNRSMRVHKIVRESLDRLLLEQFKASHGDLLTHNVKADLIKFISLPSKENLDEFIKIPTCQIQLELYAGFKEKVRQGELGKTAQYWINYMDFVWQLLKFT